MTLQWPPEYTLRRSKKSKSIRLVITKKKGLELVIPSWASQADGLDFLESRRDWVIKHYKPKKLSNEMMPYELNLRAVSESWEIEYRYQLQSPRVTLSVEDNRLIFSGPIENLSDINPLLRKWLIQKAYQYFPAMIEQFSQAYQLPFNQLTIRFQETRWGSCNHRKAISLNARLLFLTPEEVRYVMIHELCHTKFLNHSSRFWALVERCMPDYWRYEKLMKSIQAEL